METTEERAFHDKINQIDLEELMYDEFYALIAEAMKIGKASGHEEATRWRKNIDINESAYRGLINQNIEELNKYMPEESLERKHIIDIMKSSIFLYYGDLSTVKISEK